MERVKLYIIYDKNCHSLFVCRTIFFQNSGATILLKCKILDIIITKVHFNKCTICRDPLSSTTGTWELSFKISFLKKCFLCITLTNSDLSQEPIESSKINKSIYPLDYMHSHVYSKFKQNYILNQKTSK